MIEKPFCDMTIEELREAKDELAKSVDRAARELNLIGGSRMHPRHKAELRATAKARWETRMEALREVKERIKALNIRQTAIEEKTKRKAVHILSDLIAILDPLELPPGIRALIDEAKSKDMHTHTNLEVF